MNSLKDLKINTSNDLVEKHNEKIMMISKKMIENK